MEPVTPEEIVRYFHELADALELPPAERPMAASEYPELATMLRAAADRIEELTDKLNKAEQACKFFLDWQDREHAWVHRLEDVIAEERGRVEELEREIAEYWEPLREGLER